MSYMQSPASPRAQGELEVYAENSVMVLTTPPFSIMMTQLNFIKCPLITTTLYKYNNIIIQDTEPMGALQNLILESLWQREK